jgi:hypothetical protein
MLDVATKADISKLLSKLTILETGLVANKQWLSINEACKYLDCSRKSLYDLLNRHCEMQGLTKRVPFSGDKGRQYINREKLNKLGI